MMALLIVPTGGKGVSLVDDQEGRLSFSGGAHYHLECTIDEHTHLTYVAAAAHTSAELEQSGIFLEIASHCIGYRFRHGRFSRTDISMEDNQRIAVSESVEQRNALAVLFLTPCLQALKIHEELEVFLELGVAGFEADKSFREVG